MQKRRIRRHGADGASPFSEFRRRARIFHKPVLRTAVSPSKAKTGNERAAPPLRRYLITSQKSPATATKPRVKTSVRMNGIASQ